jgi:hypothetical protein
MSEWDEAGMLQAIHLRINNVKPNIPMWALIICSSIHSIGSGWPHIGASVCFALLALYIAVKANDR